MLKVCDPIVHIYIYIHTYIRIPYKYIFFLAFMVLYYIYFPLLYCSGIFKADLHPAEIEPSTMPQPLSTRMPSVLYSSLTSWFNHEVRDKSAITDLLFGQLISTTTCDICGCVPFCRLLLCVRLLLFLFFVIFPVHMLFFLFSYAYIFAHCHLLIPQTQVHSV